jgi:hypothetical protein
MLGLGTIASAVITPKHSGIVLAWITFLADNSVTTGALNVQGFFGTGTPPTYGAAVSGTAFGELKTVTGSFQSTILLMAKVTGLTLNTAYWFDCSLQAVSTGTANIKQVDVVLLEL